MSSILDRIHNSYKVRAIRDAASAVWWWPDALSRRVSLASYLRSRPAFQIHLGCGAIADPRFLNVDARPFSHVHYVTKSVLMPALPKDRATMIYACHVFEHIPYDRQRAVLRRWHDLLRSKGELRLAVPDFDKVTAQYQAGERDFEWMQWVLMGGQDYPYNFHYALFTEDRLRRLLEAAGFLNVRRWNPQEEKDWPKDHSWEESLSLNLCADKP